MKIEVELKDIELLRSEISSLKEQREALVEKLKLLDEKEFKKQATDLANKMFIDVMNKILEEIGFADKIHVESIPFTNLEKSLGVNWWSSERLDFDLGIIVTSKFKKAFAKLGVKY
jgi:hypothetical protein